MGGIELIALAATDTIIAGISETGGILITGAVWCSSSSAGGSESTLDASS